MPKTSERLRAALLLAEILPIPLKPLRPLTKPPSVSRIILDPGEALASEGRIDRTGIVIIHGANPGGVNDPRMRTVVDAFGRLGHPVIAPALKMGQGEVDRSDIHLVLACIDHLYEQLGRAVKVVAFSWGAAFAMVALGDNPAMQPKVRSVATVGAFFDPVHLFQGVTCGRIIYEGSEETWSPAADAAERVTDYLARALPDDQASALRSAFRAQDPAPLGPEARSIYELMANADPAKTQALMSQLPAHLASLFREISPARVATELRIPVHALHSIDDPASPPGQSRALVQAVPNDESSYTEVSLFRHVTPAHGARVWLRDGKRLIDYTARLLGS